MGKRKVDKACTEVIWLRLTKEDTARMISLMTTGDTMASFARELVIESLDRRAPHPKSAKEKALEALLDGVKKLALTEDNNV